MNCVTKHRRHCVSFSNVVSWRLSWGSILKYMTIASKTTLKNTMQGCFGYGPLDKIKNCPLQKNRILFTHEPLGAVGIASVSQSECQPHTGHLQGFNVKSQQVWGNSPRCVRNNDGSRGGSWNNMHSPPWCNVVSVYCAFLIWMRSKHVCKS